MRNRLGYFGKNVKWIVTLMIALVGTVLPFFNSQWYDCIAQQSYYAFSPIVLTENNLDAVVSPGTAAIDARIYGTTASNQITLESGARAELINFPGSNSIQIQSSSGLFTVFRSGTVVTFQGSDETVLKIPATKDVQTISFNGEESRVLQIYNNQVMLDDQVITSTSASIEGSQEEPVSCGAYVAPGVWKEFDCYNLAAIGKTTNDDPFTPSWRLIGGYWQWGRKGPSSAQLTIRLLNTVQNEAGHNPVEGFSEITFTVGGTEVTVDITSIANDDTLDYTTAYDEIVDAINAQLTADGFDTGTAARGPIDDAVFSIPVAGFAVGDNAGDYYPIIVTNTGSEELAGIDIEPSPLSYDTDLIYSFDASHCDASHWHDTNTANFAHGPTGPGAGEANSGRISNWYVDDAPDGSWSDASKTANDPCPAGYRVPTQTQWDGVMDNNTQSTVGTWDSDDTNYSSARVFGDKLMLPAAGGRYHEGGSGSLTYRGRGGYYWSSTESSGTSYGGYAWGLNFISSYADASNYYRGDGFSVRCVAE